jgi:hypothetical protein
MMQPRKNGRNDNGSISLDRPTHRSIVCTENLNPDIVMMKASKDRA